MKKKKHVYTFWTKRTRRTWHLEQIVGDDDVDNQS